ncbi:MAG: AAA family ATPase [Candidatus Margulisbacteria bacterium]|nr:AAA family ATPase [Candidatus Margulisiibacteriota bacterium]MBU1021761.1 AAA family ATPase [Candidatus Margulisiibacteriota bacterium]MBU1729507.1 AAA family ATPase [Candidatus Margulisiibacteriota bacterium]MBU1955392.1 AAA family ATPase [Candidatus Margulisiibacteriota bacterium]
MATVFATVNQKGGVGKTTTAVNLAAYLAAFGKRILLIDSDPQGNASSGVGIDRDHLEKCLYDVIIGNATLDETIVPSQISGLDVVPSTPRLSGADIELVPEPDRELRLKLALTSVQDKYDLIFIDCPPSLSLLTINALVAADEVIIPIQCEYYALEGIGQLNNTLNLIKHSLNPELKIRGIILTMYNARTVLAEQVAEEARKFFGSKVFETIIPRNIRLAEAPSFGQPILFYDPGSTGAKAYEKLTKEMLDGEFAAAETQVA